MFLSLTFSLSWKKITKSWDCSAFFLQIFSNLLLCVLCWIFFVYVYKNVSKTPLSLELIWGESLFTFVFHLMSALAILQTTRSKLWVIFSCIVEYFCSISLLCCYRHTPLLLCCALHGFVFGVWFIRVKCSISHPPNSVLMTQHVSQEEDQVWLKLPVLLKLSSAQLHKQLHQRTPTFMWIFCHGAKSYLSFMQLALLFSRCLAGAVRLLCHLDDSQVGPLQLDTIYKVSVSEAEQSCLLQASWELDSANEKWLRARNPKPWVKTSC